MTMATEIPRTAIRRAAFTSPLALLLAALILVMILLSLPLSAPVGPMYWDVFIYYDAAGRMFDGQVPIVDFFTPVGPLGYYLFAGWLWLFPNAQPSLLAHWMLLAVTLPLMAIVASDIDRRSRVTALALVVPFLLFALLPFNNREFYPFPGSDAFGIYNRQVCQLLYVLVAALIFMRNQRLLAIVVTVTMLALFLIKVTGFVAALIICLFAFVTGRLLFRYAAAAAIAFFAVLGLLELSVGIVSIYFIDILKLVGENQGTLLPRLVQSASLTFGIVAPAGLLAIVVLIADRKTFAARWQRLRSAPSIRPAMALIDHNAVWLAVLLFTGVLFESQNTGSQAMIFIWPVVLSILLGSATLISRPKILIATMILAAAAVMPMAINAIDRAGRAYIGSVKNVRLPSDNLKTLGAVNLRSDFLDRAQHMASFYASHQVAIDELADAGEMSSYILFSEPDFQATNLLTVDRAITSIRKLEADRGIRFETMMTLSFVNVFPYLMERSAPLHIAIGADPFRAVPDLTAQEEQAVRNVDIALLPKCPGTTATVRLTQIYAASLKDHKRIRLDDCYDAFINPRLAGKLAP